MKYVHWMVAWHVVSIKVVLIHISFIANNLLYIKEKYFHEHFIGLMNNFKFKFIGLYFSYIND